MHTKETVRVSGAHRVLRRAGKVLLWSLAGLVILIVLAVGTFMGAVHTEWGRKQVLSRLQPILEKEFPGGARIGAFGGSLIDGLDLHDVVIRDAEGQPAVIVKRLTAHYALGRLLAHQVKLDRVVVEGATVHARKMKDGRWNLTALVAESQQPASSGKPWDLIVGDARAEAHLVVDDLAPGAAGSLGKEPLTADVRLQGKVSRTGTTLKVHLDGLDAETSQPARAKLRVHGDLTLDKVLHLDGVALEVATRGEEIERAVPSVTLKGPIAIEAKAGGTLDGLDVQLAVKPERGAITATGRLAIVGGQPVWHGNVAVKELDPGLWKGVPHGGVDAMAEGHGTGGQMTVNLSSLRAHTGGVVLAATGSFTTPDEIDAHVHADGDLARALAVEARAENAVKKPHERKTQPPPLKGHVHASAQVAHHRGVWTVKANLDVKDLAAPSVTAKQVTARVSVSGTRGYATVEAHSTSVVGRPVEHAQLDIVGDSKAISAGFLAHGPGLRAAMEAHGKPRKDWSGVDGRLERLLVAGVGAGWGMPHPASFAAGKDGVGITGFVLQHGEERLTLDGSLRDGRIGGHLTLQQINVTALARVFKPKLLMPTVIANADLHAAGTTESPSVNGTLGAQIDPHGDKWALQTRLALASHRARVDGELKGPDGASVKIVGDAPVPLAENSPLSATVTARSLRLQRLKTLWERMQATVTTTAKTPPKPPKEDSFTALLKGTIEADVKLAGTMRRPALDVNAKLGWPIPNPVGLNELRVGAQSRPDHTALQVNLKSVRGGNASLQAQSPLDAFTIAKRGLDPHLPLSLNLDADVDLAHLHLPDKLGVPKKGKVKLSVRGQGTLGDPSVDLRVDAREFNVGEAEPIGLRGTVAYGAKKAVVDLILAFRGGDLVHATGGADVDVKQAILDRAAPDGPVKVALEVPNYDLKRLRGLIPNYEHVSGILTGRVDVTGRVLDPRLNGVLRADGFSDGRLVFDRFLVAGAWDGAVAKATVRAVQRQGGHLALDGSYTKDGGAIDAKAEILRFDLGFLPTVAPVLSAAGGTIDANLRVSGTPAVPILVGTLKSNDASFALRDEGHLYDHIGMDVDFTPGNVAIHKLTARSGEGTATVEGSIGVKGLKPTHVDATVVSNGFEVAAGSIATSLKGRIKVHAEEKDGELVGKIAVEEGTLKLPALAAGGKKLQPTGDLQDVIFVDEKARKKAKKDAQAAREAEPIELDFRLPGAFALRGKDVEADMTGSLHITAKGPKMSILGLLETNGGWVDIVGNRYTIDHARITFNGGQDVNPTLDVRLMRTIGDVTVYIDVGGTSAHPDIDLSADPARYSQSEIIGLIISGDPGNQSVDERSLDQKVVGALSGAVIGKLKDAILPGLPVDVLKVELGAEGYTGAATTRVEVGKYISHNVYVSYVHQFGTPQGLVHINSNQITMEWRFARRFEIDTSYGDAGVGGLDLAFHVRF